MHRKTRLNLTDLNPLLICSLCKGYLIDATTLTECLHSFCRSCLVRYLQTSQQCPKCDTMVHKTRPLHNASSSRSARSPGNLGVDRALQNIVYKLVPGLFKDEMKKRRDFYTAHPQAGTSTSATPSDREARGEVGEEALVIYSDDEHMNLSLEYFLPTTRKRTMEKEKEKDDGDGPAAKRSKNDAAETDDIVDKRYLRCPAAVCVKHIKKFIRNKFDLKPSYQVEISHVDNEDDCLPDDYTLMDVAYIYAWRRNGPLPLVFRVFKDNPSKRSKTGDLVEAVTEGEPSKLPVEPRHPPTTGQDHASQGPSINKEHSKPGTPPPPSLVKESTEIAGNQNGSHQREPSVVGKTTAAASATISCNNKSMNGTKRDVNGGTVRDGLGNTLKIPKFSKTLSNNNDKTENGGSKSMVSSPSLKASVPTSDLPPALATVGLVPAR